MRLLPLLLLLTLLGCQPKQTAEVDTPGVPADSLAETVDSVNNVRQDGTLTTPPASEDIKQRLPPELEVLLDQTVGLWQLPQVQDQARALLTQDQQGPYFLQTDLNNDQQTDYVVQVISENMVRVYAFLRPVKEEQPWTEAVLESKPLVTLDGRQRSPFSLSLLEEKTDTTGNLRPEKEKRKGILVHYGNATTWYQWRAGKWEKASLPAASAQPQ